MSTLLDSAHLRTAFGSQPRVGTARVTAPRRVRPPILQIDFRHRSAWEATTCSSRYDTRTLTIHREGPVHLDQDGTHWLHVCAVLTNGTAGRKVDGAVAVPGAGRHAVNDPG